MIEKVRISLEEAKEIILDHTLTLGCERLSIMESLHRVLAQDIHAQRDHPPWNNSAMDGYAVQWRDICDVSPGSPAKLNIIGEVQAGGIADKTIAKGEAIQIMTGAPTPAGADTVVCVEDTYQEGEYVFVNQTYPQGSNIRLKGEDVRLGDLVLPAGCEIGPAQVGILATAAHSSVLVHQRPTVSVLATGNELVEPGEQLTPEKIINSNSYSVSALTRESGAINITLPSAKDNREDLEDKIKQALQADIALIVGGVSMGKYDYVKEVLEEQGCQFKFWRVAMRPGHPVAFGIIKNNYGQHKLVFGLPGNPVSCVVAFYQFVHPAIRKMMGHKTLHLKQIEATLESEFNKKPGRTHLARANTIFRDGQYHVRIAPNQGSGILTSFVDANSLAILPADHEHFSVGERIQVQLLP